MSPHRRPVPLWYAMLAVMMSTLMLAGAGIWYTHYSQRQSDRRWCELFTIMSGGPPATTERGRVIADAMERLRVDLGC